MEAVRRRVSGHHSPQDAVLLLEPGQRLLGAAADLGLELGVGQAGGALAVDQRDRLVHDRGDHVGAGRPGEAPGQR